MGNGVFFVDSNGKRVKMNRTEFCHYIGNLWIAAREAKKEQEEIDKRMEEKEDV